MPPSPARAALVVLPTLTLAAFLLSQALLALVPWPAPHGAALDERESAVREPRDPERVLSGALFALPPDVPIDVSGDATHDPASPACTDGLALRGVYLRGSGAVAAIASSQGTHVITTGERVGELVVESIERERAVLARDDGSRCTLSLFSSEPAVSTAALAQP